MGLTAAGSWFQYVMSHIVLQGLAWQICVVYLDDILVYADTEAQLVERLTTIFDRFHSIGITLNPDKCEFGIQEVEFVGHLIDYQGLRFTDQKLNGIKDFKLPRLQRGLKSFLGLANYFRDHVPGHSVIAIPLQQALAGYDRKQRMHTVKWTPEARQAFEDMKDAIINCQRL